MPTRPFHRAALRSRIQQPLAGQHVQCLTQHRAADTVARHQHILAGQQIARLKPAVDDVAAQYVHQLLAQIPLQRADRRQAGAIHRARQTFTNVCRLRIRPCGSCPQPSRTRQAKSPLPMVTLIGLPVGLEWPEYHNTNRTRQVLSLTETRSTATAPPRRSPAPPPVPPIRPHPSPTHHPVTHVRSRMRHRTRRRTAARTTRCPSPG